MYLLESKEHNNRVECCSCRIIKEKIESNEYVDEIMIGSDRTSGLERIIISSLPIHLFSATIYIDHSSRVVGSFKDSIFF